MDLTDRQKIVQELSKKLGKQLTRKLQASKESDLLKNSPITQREAAFLKEQTEKNRELLMQEMDERISQIRKEFEPSKDKREWEDVIRIYAQGKDGPKWQKMQQALDAIEDVVEPYKGYGVQEAKKFAQADISWDELQRIKKYTKIAMANAFVQEKTSNEVNGSAISLDNALNSLQNEEGGQQLIEAFKKTTYTTDTLRKLILLDDWDNIKEGAISMAKELGPMAVKYLVKRYLPNIQIGADSGGWIGDYSSDPRQASKQVIIQGGNDFNRIDRSISRMSNRINGCSAKYISTFICPERFTFRRPQNYPVKTAIIGSTQELQIKTDDRGNGALYLNPSAPFVSGANYHSINGVYTGFDSFWAFSPTKCSSDIHFVPETGNWDDINQGGNQDNNLAIAKTCVYPGPLAQHADTVTRLKTAGFAVNYTPTSSNSENSGSVIFGYYPYSSLGNLGNGTSPTSYGPSLGTNAITQSQYCQMGNAKTSYRYSHIPDSKNDLDLQYTFIGQGKLDEIYCLIVTGAQPNSIVGKIDIAFDYEYIPSFDSQLLSQQEYPTQGARTSDLINVLVQQFPTLLSMTFDDAYRLANSIMTNCDDDYEQIYHYINQYMNKHNVFFEKMESQVTAKRNY